MFSFRLCGANRLRVGVLSLLLVAACVRPGANEFVVYQSAFNESYQVGQLVLDKLAVAERKAFANARQPIAPGTVYFDPGEARYLADRVDPPATASLRKSLDIVKSYTETVSALATGESATAIAGRLTEIGTTAASVAVQVTTPISSGQKAVVDKLAQKTQPLRALEPITALGFGVLTRAEFRRTVVAEADTIDTIFSEIIELTGHRSDPAFASKIGSDPGRACFDSARVSIFCLLIDDLIFEADGVGGLKPFNKEQVARVEGLQVLLANWVVLLQSTRTALDQSVTAIENRQSRANSTSILKAISEMDAAAKGVRDVLAEQ